MLFSKGKFHQTYDFLVAGLGNPGKEYENTRHNAGFLALSRFCEINRCDTDRSRFFALTGDCRTDGKRLLLLRPTTYMNNSGEAVSAAAAYYNIPPERTIVIFDDISLPVGKMRIRRNGSAGGHNGIKSIISELGSDNFPRIKIGIGERPHPDYDLKDWVLSRFKNDELTALSPVLDAAAAAVLLIADGKIDDAMNRFNNR